MRGAACLAMHGLCSRACGAAVLRRRRRVRHVRGADVAALPILSHLPSGKYLLVRDANKPQLRLYHVPAEASSALEADVEDEEGEEGAGGEEE